jgi:hypothetical protein
MLAPAAEVLEHAFQCLETQKLEQLEARMDEIADRVARDRTNAARERTSTDEAQRHSN